MSRAWVWGPTLAGLVAACAAPSEELARAQWLRHTLILDNQVFLDRDPELAGGKLAMMSEGPYPWFRGTAAQYARDVMEPGGLGYLPSRFETKDTRDVALVGDPHPENIGTFAHAGELSITVELNDFDAATFGPYDFDLRRLALGFWIAGEQIIREGAELEPARRGEAARAVVRGYADEIAALADDPDGGGPMTADDSLGVILGDLVDGAIEDGQAQEKQDQYTRIEDGRRVMFYGDVDPPRSVELGPFSQRVYENTVRSLDARDQARIEALLSGYATTIVGDVPHDAAALRLKGTSRRLGAGVSSYPALRYYALVEGPTTAVEDDVLLELKQVIDAVPMPGLQRYPAQPFYSNAERVAQMQRRLQNGAEADPWLGWVVTGGDGYRLRWRTGYQRTLRVRSIADDLAAGDITADDFVELAEVAGRLLARSHGHALRQEGSPGAPAIASAIGGDDQGLVDEVADFVETYAPQVLDDYDAFVELLQTHGPNLGYIRR